MCQDLYTLGANPYISAARPGLMRVQHTIDNT